MFCTAAIFWSAELFAGLHRDQIWELLRTVIFYPSKVPKVKALRKKRPPRAQSTPETFPLPWECGASVTIWVLYLIARTYVLVEMFVGLRTLPRSAYKDVDWSNFLPHSHRHQGIRRTQKHHCCQTQGKRTNCFIL